MLEGKEAGCWMLEAGIWVMVIVVLLCTEVTARSRPPFRKHWHWHASEQAILVGIEFVRGNQA